MNCNAIRWGAALGALLLCTAQAHAFRLIGAIPEGGTVCAGALLECGDDDVFARWWNYPVPFWVNEDSDADANEADFNQADIIAACQASYQAWEDVPFAIITFRYQGETSARLGADGINTTLWFNAAFDRGQCAGALGAAGGTVAITVLTENEVSGQIIDADVIMDSVDSWEINLACVEFDMQSVLTHEYGHSIGIHHSELPAGAMATRPTMNAFVFCDAGIGSGRTLEPDDEAAAQCLYPELPTVVLMDQTGSMCVGNRMPDAQAAANDFISSYSSNVMAVAGFAEGNTAECGGCAPRPGYELLQDWTVDSGALQAAINGTFPCGFTPLWESVCCAIDKADENGPSNLLIFTDTGENSSNGTCGCTTFPDVLNTAIMAGDVTVYVIDMTNYFGPAPGPSEAEMIDVPNAQRGGGDQSANLRNLCERTRGLYVEVTSPSQMGQAVDMISHHINGNGMGDPTCRPELPIDDIQTYFGACNDATPYLDDVVTLTGVVTAKRGTWDANTQYIEDCSGGIQLFGPTSQTGQIGDVVTVTGRVGVAFGEIRLSGLTRYDIVDRVEPQTLPVVGPASGLACESIGTLMSIRGFVAGPVQDDRFTLLSDLGTSEPPKITVFLDPDTHIDPTQFQTGDEYVITGIVTHLLNANELKPRDQGDIDPIGSTSDADPLPVQNDTSVLLQLSPNPSHGGTELRYQLAEEGPVRLQIFDAQGRLVRSLVEGTQAPSQYSVAWDGRSESGSEVASGLYFVKFTGPDGQAHSRTLVMVR